MARSIRAWFEFAGKNSKDMGLYPADAPQIITAARRVNAQRVAGRSGDIALSDGAYEPIEIQRSCTISQSRIAAAQRWLTGSADLILSNRPDAAYEARIDQPVTFTLIAPGSDPVYECTVIFTCQPHPRIYPAAGEITFTQPGEIINPGTAPAQPRIEIRGTGDFSLTIGMQTMYFTGVQDGLVIDSELGDVLTPDESGLMNACADGALFCIEPGLNTVTWTSGSRDTDGNPTPGHIEHVTILPRWRYI